MFFYIFRSVHFFNSPKGCGKIVQNGQTEPMQEVLAWGYPKAYIGTSSGEVCS